MKHLLSCLLGFTLLMCVSCKKSDPALPDNTLGFSTSTQGLGTTDAFINISLNLNRATDVAIPVVVDLTASGVTYGTEFTTEPAATTNMLNLTIPAGSNAVSFKVIKKDDIFLQGNESLTFKVKSAGAPVVLGTTTELKLSFSAITSTGSELTLNGGEGGSAAINSVYVDLSANAQTAVKRTSWDLGFYTGADFRVILNNTTAASVVAVNKTDINAINATDVTLANLELGQGKGNFGIIDDVNGDITKTAIAAVSVTEAENKVYVISRVNGTGATPLAADVYKIRILRNGTTGYTLQYAKLNETTFKTLDINKNAASNFSFISFDTGAVSVEPAKDRWDFVWGYSIYYTGTLPYAFSDLVFVNHLGDVTTAEVIGNYDTYAEANIATTTFSNSRNTIGSNWRVTQGTIGVKTDRFYVIKDAAGNVYKLRFVNFTTQDGGTRGYPKIQYTLVKKGA
ncbi:HmuY family protein [Mucilaginibacter auburnensis]|uniref:Heme-binding HmuY-like protein n=1 Tax=Mucilaginibacter auburnensis TaxID=1457233 RepID=A0A2H9VW26_9SPHI|nr:HmuY family protein [Mucilaginibacter auburnensis]PJJ85016.1 heme-binding HmuY-like protein [Mucilaginibacter auburnensis]